MKRGKAEEPGRGSAERQLPDWKSRRQEMLHWAFDTLGDGVYVVSENYDILYVNPVIVQRSGSTPGSRKCFEYFHNEKSPCPWCRMHEVFAGQTVRRSYRTRTGVTYLVCDAPLPNPDGSADKLGFLFDITSRQRREDELRGTDAEYRALMLGFPGIVYRGGADFTPTFFRGAAEAITGYSPAELTSGKPRWDMIIHPEDRASLVKPTVPARRAGGEVTEREYRILHRDGTVRRVRETMRTTCDVAGEPSGVVGVIVDITSFRAP